MCEGIPRVMTVQGHGQLSQTSPIGQRHLITQDVGEMIDLYACTKSPEGFPARFNAIHAPGRADALRSNQGIQTYIRANINEYISRPEIALDKLAFLSLKILVIDQPGEFIVKVQNHLQSCIDGGDHGFAPHSLRRPPGPPLKSSVLLPFPPQGFQQGSVAQMPQTTLEACNGHRSRTYHRIARLLIVESFS